MLSVATLEQINFEQLVTPTDRMLLRSRHARNRLSETKIVYRPAFKVELAEERLQIEPAIPASEHTLFIRARRFGTSTTTAAILATLFSIALILLLMVPR